MSSFIPQHLGKYLLLEKIAVGGMAELFKAKVTGEGGFEKLVAIKRILPHLSADKELVSMFIDEARVAALLNHQNIVQIYDFGKEDDTYFIAMEYLEGWDLKTVLQKAGEWLPLEFSLHITTRVCAGLDYSHNMKDLKGENLHLVHRDISPQNIFITSSGEVKILDFGIAQLARRDSSTRIGLLKGKVSYMSPEQAAGKPIDRRSDIFSTGIVLYEMIAGMKMFQGDPLEVLEQVRCGIFQPIERVAPGLAQEIYAVVQKALSKDPEERFQSCAEMLSALEGCLDRYSAPPTAERLSKHIQSLFIGQPDATETGAEPEPVHIYEEQNHHYRSMPDSEWTGRTQTIFDDKDLRETYTVPRVRNRWTGSRIGVLSLTLAAVVLMASIFVSSKFAGRQEQGKGQPTQGMAEKKEPRVETGIRSEPIKVPLPPREPPATLPEVHNDAARAQHLLEEGMRLAPEQPGKAAKNIAESIKLEPGNARAYFALATIEAKLHHYPKAIELLEHAGTLDPNYQDVFFNLGCLYAEIKDFTTSERMYLRTVALAPSYLDEVYFCLAMVQKEQGKLGESKESLQRALEINPANQAALKYLEKTDPSSQNLQKRNLVPGQQRRKRVPGLSFWDQLNLRIARFMNSN